MTVGAIKEIHIRNHYLPPLVKYVLRQAKAKGQKVKLRYAEYDWSVRGVFFKGHDVDEQTNAGCPLRTVQIPEFDSPTPTSAQWNSPGTPTAAI